MLFLQIPTLMTDSNQGPLSFTTPGILFFSLSGSVLCPYYVVNQTPNVDQGIIRVPEPLPLGGQRKAIASKAGDKLYFGIPSYKAF